MTHEEIINKIKENKECFPVQLNNVTIKKEEKNNVNSIFINKYNCFQLLNDDFYKCISRIL